MFESDLENQAYHKFETAVLNYTVRFKILLFKIYISYEQILVDNQNLPKYEDEITKILVDKYLIKIDDLDIVKNIDNLNLVSENIIGELVDITKEITLEDENLYKSTYKTIKAKKFIIYHLMMDFSKML